MKIKFWKKIQNQIRDGNEKGARESVLEDLFNDFNRNRFSIYKFNFFRGIFFGLGSVIGGTIVVALLIWILNAVGLLVPSLADLVRSIVDLMAKPVR